MKIKLLLMVTCCMALLQACTKQEITKPEPIGKASAALDTVPNATIFTIANILQSNMVIQRDKPFRVWGTANSDCVVRVKVSWNSATFTAIADSTGSWKVVVPATPVNATPQTIAASINGLPAVTLGNILIGDVWLCIGQSNMVMPMARINNPDSVLGGFYGVENYQSEIANANHPNLRYVQVPANFQTSPVNNIGPVQWSVCSPATAGAYSALGYYFGEKIDSALNIPVGIIVAAFSSTTCQAWTSAQTLQANPILDSYYYGTGLSSECYNGMIYPLRNLYIKGVIWDQGENNMNDIPASNYTLLNSAMITQWRNLFNQEVVPFYFVQMTPLVQANPVSNDYYAKFREAQANVRTTTPNTGFAVTMDIPDLFVIHYTYKEPVADRLARLAMYNDYGLPVAAAGPRYQSFVQKDSTLIITFNNASGLQSIGPIDQDFFVSGVDQVFYPAIAAISGNTIVLALPPTVTNVTAVRYAFTNTSVTSIYNGANLPMEPFRTDNYPD
jgi:sialate O-acetylesterase